MNKPKHHIFICTSSRINGQQKGYCHTKDGIAIVERFMEEITDVEEIMDEHIEGGKVVKRLEL